MIFTINPKRTCLGCMKKFDKEKLQRIVKRPDGKVILDKTGTEDGRGAYLCKNTVCVKIAEKKNKLNRALKCEVDFEIYKMLTEGFDDGKDI